MKNHFLFIDSDCDPHEAKSRLAAYLQNSPLPDCLIVSSDHMLLGAHSALMEAGLRIPQDLQLLSSDGTHYCEFLFPGISSIQQPVNELCIRSASILQQRILHGKKTPRHSFSIIPKIIYRNSTNHSPAPTPTDQFVG